MGERRTPAARRPRRACAGPRPGFTLIEVLVAVAVLATGIVLVLEAFQTSFAALNDARHALRKSSLARGKIGELTDRGRRGDLPDGTARGAFEEPYAAYAWETTVRAVREGAASSNRLKRLTVRVSTTPARRPFEVQTYVLERP